MITYGQYPTIFIKPRPLINQRSHTHPHQLHTNPNPHHLYHTMLLVHPKHHGIHPHTLHHTQSFTTSLVKHASSTSYRSIPVSFHATWSGVSIEPNSRIVSINSL